MLFFLEFDSSAAAKTLVFGQKRRKDGGGCVGGRSGLISFTLCLAFFFVQIKNEIISTTPKS